MKLTRRNSSSAGVSALHCGGGGSASGAAASRSVSAAISACFSTRRCNCQTPRPTKHRDHDASVKMPKPATRRRLPESCDHFGSRSISRPGRGLVMELQRDQQRLHRAQRQQRGREDQRQPQRGVQPERRLVFDLDDQRAADHDGAGDHDDEHRRPVAGIDEGVIEPAGFAARPQVRKPAYSLPLPQRGHLQASAAQRALGHGGQCLGLACVQPSRFTKQKGRPCGRPL